jgi:hypothetical protein
MATAFAAGNEDDVSLGRVRILVLENEKLVYAILLESGNFDDTTDWPDEAAIKD